MAMMAFRLRRAVALARPFSTFSSSSSNGFLQKSVSSTMPPAYRPLSGFIEPSPLYDFIEPSSLSRCMSGRFMSSETGSIRERVLEGMYPNHWLILMEWPDPQPSREEKIDAFVQTLTRVMGSEEEAKKAIYAVSTTLYTGFMCRVPEELSEKLKNEPGVVKVLASIDKLYGIGDKYNMGVITPDPPSPNSRSGGNYNERPRNRRRDSMALRNRDIQMARDPLPEAVGVNTTQSGSTQAGVQDYRPAVDGRSTMMGDRQDDRAAMDGRGPIGGGRQDNRPQSMDGGVRDYGLPPRDGRAQDYGLPPRGGRGPDYGTPMDTRGPDYKTPIDGRGPDYRTPMDRRGPDNRTTMERRDPDFSSPMGGRDPDYRTPMDGRGPDYRTQGYGPPMSERGPLPSGEQPIPWPMEGTN